MNFNYLEIAAVISTLLCVILLNKKYVLGWPVGILAAGLYILVFQNQNLYAQSSLQLIFIIQSAYGWYLWNGDSGQEIKIVKIDYWILFTHILLVVVISLSIYPLIGDLGGENSFLDILTTLLALLANYYLSKKILQSWLVWGLVDVLLLGLFAMFGLWWSFGLYIILTIIAINAYLTWNNDYEKQI